MGKFIGAILGYMAGGIFGALLGFFVGQIIDRSFKFGSFTHQIGDRQEAQDTFFTTVFTLLGYLAKADGRVSEAEVQLTEQLMSKLGLTPEHRRAAIDLFKQGSQHNFSLTELLAKFNHVCGRHTNLKQMLLVYLINIALADGAIEAEEEAILRQVAQHIGFSGFAFEQLLRMINAQNQFGGQRQGGAYQQAPSANDLDVAYAALGVDKSISDKDLKRAYRKLMSQYHPDKLMGQGLPADMIQEATERSQEVQAAYDLIQKSRKQ
ncbi:co-chaperone DjlA [Aestuariicella hydrocarbonica]|uniref:Co-chaperone protein DjlA n=1 Tax=Pseudomaricurvus hydrocarbonicus TaxID=1470433 RepID=A0A9E5MPK2_9GAMM|nr:co-chaperone DjlA [Aestuariicella hydrocarbonica]NHO68075.1 co-chaperone DjlA [Aestuariicella hydrocarbonica]